MKCQDRALLAATKEIIATRCKLFHDWKNGGTLQGMLEDDLLQDLRLRGYNKLSGWDAPQHWLRDEGFDLIQPLNDQFVEYLMHRDEPRKIKSRHRIVAYALKEPDWIIQEYLPADVEAKIWYADKRLDLSREGAKWFRYSWNKDDPRLCLIEGWKVRPANEGLVRWNLKLLKEQIELPLESAK